MMIIMHYSEPSTTFYLTSYLTVISRRKKFSSFSTFLLGKIPVRPSQGRQPLESLAIMVMIEITDPLLSCKSIHDNLVFGEITIT